MYKLCIHHFVMLDFCNADNFLDNTITSHLKQYKLYVQVNVQVT